MRRNPRFIAYGAIVAFVYRTIVSSLDGISRLIIVGGLVARLVIIESVRRSPERPRFAR
jgi:hypothetical protein